jgi:predicted ATP-grasp superfamily ATP-dependent carboligase
MRAALAEDFARLPGVDVAGLRDVRLEGGDDSFASWDFVRSADEERVGFRRWAAAADGTVVIAPEFSGHLAERVRWAEETGTRLLSPGSTFVEVTSDKQLCAERLQAAGVPVPRGQAWKRGQTLAGFLEFPLVAKPVDGAGSLDVQLLQSPAELKSLDGGTGRVWRLEPFCAGEAASVSVLCGSEGASVFPASRQILSRDGRFRYRGGEVPLPEAACRRAARLARMAVAALPATCGYIGIDLVLGAAEDGSADRVLEVNPRLTTSYLGLRRIARGNLAAAMLCVARANALN